MIIFYSPPFTFSWKQSSWWRRKWYCTDWLFPRATKAWAIWIVSSDELVKKREAARSSSSDKRLSLADMMSIASSRIFVGDADGCEGSDKGPRGWEGTLIEGWNSTEGVAVEGGAKEGIAAGAVVRGAGSVIVAAVALRLLSITLAMQLRVELRALEIMMGFRSLVLLFDDLDDHFELPVMS